MYEFAHGRGYGTKKRKEEIRKSIIACDNDIVKPRSELKILKRNHKNQKCSKNVDECKFQRQKKR